jgi:hypothetical protein
MGLQKNEINLFHLSIVPFAQKIWNFIHGSCLTNLSVYSLPYLFIVPALVGVQKGFVSKVHQQQKRTCK